MHVFRKLLAVSAAAIIAVASGVPVAQADSTPSVYDTPGGQISGDRLWRTSCEKYSTNVVRCKAEIWGTQVTYVKGRYVQTTGWTFNNLSYLPSPRSTWVGNNLGQSNSRWNSGGRTWKTECDTAITGRGGCRSYVWTKKVVAVKSGSGYSYQNREQWVFNNLVLFSSSAVPAVKKVPAHILDQSRLSQTGLGPLQLGTSLKSLKILGYLDYPSECGNAYNETEVLRSRGINTDKPNGNLVTDVITYTKGVKTVDGAQVGMTYAQVKAIYGNRMVKETKNDIPGGDLAAGTAVVRSGGNELVFMFDREGGLAQDTDKVRWIVARGYSKDLYYDGC